MLQCPARGFLCCPGRLSSRTLINSPFSEPVRHFKFTEDGITDEIVEGRRQSGYFIPVPAPKGQRRGQVDMLAESYTIDRFQPSQLIKTLRTIKGMLILELARVWVKNQEMT